MTGCTILHVEDDPNDAFLVQHAFQKAQLRVQIRLVSDGQQALDYLAGTGPYSDRKANPLPNLVILDLKMPKLSGFDVLAWVRGQERFGQIPVVVLSSSDHCDDKAHARKLGANAFEVKSPGFENIVETVETYLAGNVPLWQSTPPVAKSYSSVRL